MRFQGIRPAGLVACFAFVVVFAFSSLAAAAAAPRPDLVSIGAVAPKIKVEARYAGAHNFVGRPVKGYLAPKCLLSRPAAAALKSAADDFAGMGLTLRVYDCYRPQRAVLDFVA